MLFRPSLALLAAFIATPALAQADPGRVYFQQSCQMCHIVTPGKPGVMAPNLHGLPGRKAGATSYPYSAALKSSKLVWNRETLDRFLAAPAKVVPGTRMVVAIADAQKRAAVVAYLLTLHD